MRKGSLAYRHCSAEDLVQEQLRFDVVCSMEVIEHVDNPADFLRSLAELVKVRSGPYAILMELYRRSTQLTLTCVML